MNSSQPKVSVVIPCYNRELFIRDTVNSVLVQTYPNIEVIVVDDGCTDNSRTVLESFGDKIRILEHQGRVNKGQSAAINLGLSSATGEFVAILDSDDLFLPEKLERQVKFLMENPDVGLVYANGWIIDEHGKEQYKIYKPEHIEVSDPNALLLNCYFLLPNSSLLRREIFTKAGLFDETLRAAQDHDMAIRVSEVTKLMYIPEVLFCYRRHVNSISQKNAKTRWKNGYLILNKAYKRYPYKKRTILGRLGVLNFRLAQCYLEEKSYIKSILLFIAAGLCDPLRSLKVVLGNERISSPH